MLLPVLLLKLNRISLLSFFLSSFICQPHHNLSIHPSFCNLTLTRTTKQTGQVTLPQEWSFNKFLCGMSKWMFENSFSLKSICMPHAQNKLTDWPQYVARQSRNEWNQNEKEKQQKTWFYIIRQYLISVSTITFKKSFTSRCLRVHIYMSVRTIFIGA